MEYTIIKFNIRFKSNANETHIIFLNTWFMKKNLIKIFYMFTNEFEYD